MVLGRERERKKAVAIHRERFFTLSWGHPRHEERGNIVHEKRLAREKESVCVYLGEEEEKGSRRRKSPLRPSQ